MQSIILDLEKSKEQLRGYAILTDVANSARGFDPLVEYYELDNEISFRVNKLKELLNGGDIDIKETSKCAEFRQRAAIVFERLLEVVQNSDKTGIHKVEVNTLFNASANASLIDLDFVALALMEVSGRLSKGGRPEISSRLVRQKLMMSSITNEEAIREISEVIKMTNGFDLHLVVSEAFNIGMMISDPRRMSNLIDSAISPNLKNISYTRIARSRLLSMGSNSADWDEADKLYFAACTALKDEQPSARWFRHSSDDIARVASERPELVHDTRFPLSSFIDPGISIDQIVRRFGPQLAAQIVSAMATR